MSTARRTEKYVIADLVSQASARFTRVPARKARAIADLIRGLTVAEATRQLAIVHKPSALPVVSKVLASAVANAREKDAEDPDSLVIGEVFVDGGPILKRFHARAMGRGVQVRKRMSHVTIKLYSQA